MRLGMAVPVSVLRAGRGDPASVRHPRCQSAEGRGVPASPQRGGCSADARRNKAALVDSRLIG